MERCVKTHLGVELDKVSSWIRVSFVQYGRQVRACWEEIPHVDCWLDFDTMCRLLRIGLDEQMYERVYACSLNGFISHFTYF